MRRRLKAIQDDGTRQIPPASKVWEFNFGENSKKIRVPMLNFRLVQILPEEFFYILNGYLHKNRYTFDSVLVTTTAQLKTRFPLLNKEPLFFPVFVDIIESKEMFSIFIDALSSEEDLPQASLQAAADCAIFIDSDKNNEENNILRVKNIRGKNYERSPWIFTANSKRQLELKKKLDEKTIHHSQSGRTTKQRLIHREETAHSQL